MSEWTAKVTTNEDGPLHGLDGPAGPKASLVPGSPGTGAAAPGKLPGK